MKMFNVEPSWRACLKYILFISAVLCSHEKSLKEALSGESICKTIEIVIPEFQNAHNPSIIPYKDGYLLSFRYGFRFPEWSQDFTLLGGGAFIGLVQLDKEFKVKKNSAHLLEIQSFCDDFSLYAEDARLFLFQDQIFVLFNDFPAPDSAYIRRLYIAEIIHVNGRWIPKLKALPLVLENMNRIEKNWVPFCTDSSLYLIYGEDPHTILNCDLSTGICQIVDERVLDLDWSFGEIRGGTPAFQIGDEFLTFYHSSLVESNYHKRCIYFMGAYTFDSSFPFVVRSMTPRPIGNLTFYENTSNKNHPSKKVVFPGGFVLDGDLVHIAWGKDDKKIMITTLHLDTLLKSMKPL